MSSRSAFTACYAKRWPARERTSPGIQMPIDRPTLEAVIKASGGAQQPDDQVATLLAKLDLLEGRGRYGGLLRSIRASNNKWNFLASLLEVTFAHQFETAGVRLDYEVRQEPDQPGTIDFRMQASTSDVVFLELRLIQQDEKTTADITQQMAAKQEYAVAMDGEGERDAVVRLQGTILQKVQRKDGTPVKFVHAGAGVVNIVVVGVSDLLLGTVDAWDCVLAACGDSAVPAECRRGVVGLFQTPNAGDSPEVQARLASFAHIRATIHGVLFLFRAAGAGVLDYRLEQVMVWNQNLVTEDRAKALMTEISPVLPARK